MALGISGSNGGIVGNGTRISADDLIYETFIKQFPYPMEISYFVNNVCNLRCKHCYVGYEERQNDLTVGKWKEVFDECIELGALTFGNVGKEPTITWGKTCQLLEYLLAKRLVDPRLRFGLVTNATLLTKERSTRLAGLNPNYLDISIDGVRETHDSIRGNGMYERTITNMKAIPALLREKVFISFTANCLNYKTLPIVIRDLYDIGVRNILVSPYVSTHVQGNIEEDPLYASDEELITQLTQRLLEGRAVDFSHYQGLRIYMKTDYTTSRGLMEKFLTHNLIDRNNFLVDEYGVIFSKHEVGNDNIVYFNYIPWNNSFKQAVRISHDGYVSTCYDMFFKTYQQRAVGNLRNQRFAEILKASNNHS